MLSDISLKLKSFCICLLDDQMSAVWVKGAFSLVGIEPFLDFFIGIFSCLIILYGYSLLDVLFYWTNRCHSGLWEHFPLVGIDDWGLSIDLPAVHHRYKTFTPNQTKSIKSKGEIVDVLNFDSTILV